jgi:hypothetical protein
VSREELLAAAHAHHDLLYGELLPVGATKLFDDEHLALAGARSLCDLGSGLGKLAVQAFLQYPNLTRVFGCELSASRFKKSKDAVVQLKRLQQHCRTKLQAQLQAQGRDGQLAAAVALSDGEEEEEEESKCERREPLQGHAHALPHLSLHLEHDGETGAVCMVRYEERLAPGRRLHPLWGDLALLEGSCAEAGVGVGAVVGPAAAGMRSDSDADADAASDATSGSDCEGSSALTSTSSSPALSAACGSAASSSVSVSPPALQLRDTDGAHDAANVRHSTALMKNGPSRSLEFRCLNLFELEEALTADVVICETKFTEDKSAQTTHAHACPRPKTNKRMSVR